MREARVLISTVCFVTFAVLLSAAQVSFEQAVTDLKSPDANTRFRAVELLKDAGYPEAAAPLAAAIGDADPDVEVEAMAGELNIFLAEKVASRRRVGLVIERRSKINAEATFLAGRSAAGARAVPRTVTVALRAAMHSASPQIALDALYTFGTLAPECATADRQELLQSSAQDLAAMLGLPSMATRIAALRVTGRVYARRAGDPAVDELVGDAVIAALNDRSPEVKAAAMEALGAMKYDRAVKGLTELFQYYKKGSLGEGALDALAHIGSPASIPVFASQLSAPTPFRVIAIEGLARAGDASKSKEIDAALEGGRSDALNLAGWFASARLSKGPIEQIVEALARPALHEQAFEYLAELAPGRVRELAPGTKDPDAGIRADVADVLGMSGDAAAVPVVSSMTKDTDPVAARAAARALTRLSGAR